MVDKSKQLVIRVDLYFGYILIVALIISVCELPLLALWIQTARYVFPVGWLLLLLISTRKMWRVKVEHGLTSYLQIYKIVAFCILLLMSGPLVWASATELGPVQASQFGDVAKLVCILNVMATFAIYAMGIVGIYLIDTIRTFGRGGLAV